MYEIKGKVALITGGASGLGFQYAIELLKNKSKGVALGDVNEELGKKAVEDLQREFGEERIIFIKFDVRSWQQFRDAFEKTVEVFGNVDVLINNAGILDDSKWKTEIDINLNGTIIGTLLGIQEYLSRYKSGAEGVILNVSSQAGILPWPVCPIYSATKYAIIGLTRSFGTKHHYKSCNVRIFAVCPGFTKTPGLDNLEKKTVNPIYVTHFEKLMKAFVYQGSEHVAREVVKLIRNARNGSVWAISNNQEPYEHFFPSMSKM